MRIVSWNVNGLRALHRKGQWQWFLDNKPDIFCIQETKSRPEQLPDEVRSPEGYFSYFDSPKEKKGYSGVAIYSKTEPKSVLYEIGKGYDDEGRLIAADYDDFVLFNVYFPNGGGGPARLKFKLEFYDVFLAHINKLKKAGREIIFCGDINTAHHEIDLARPKENEKNTGFLPIERAWLDKVVKSGYVDVFRHFYPDKREAYTYWDQKTFARERNVGWRIDYFFTTPALVPKIREITIHDDVFGSDHCPIEIDVKL